MKSSGSNYYWHGMGMYGRHVWIESYALSSVMNSAERNIYVFKYDWDMFETEEQKHSWHFSILNASVFIWYPSVLQSWVHNRRCANFARIHLTPRPHLHAALHSCLWKELKVILLCPEASQCSLSHCINVYIKIFLSQYFFMLLIKLIPSHTCDSEYFSTLWFHKINVIGKTKKVIFKAPIF